MSLEQAIEKLTAAIEAATGVLVTLGAVGKVAGAPASTPAPAPAPAPAPKVGRPAKAPPAPAPAPVDEGLGDDDGGLGEDNGLGGADEPVVTVEEAKAAVLAYRDKAIKTIGKDEGLNTTRALMKKYVAALDDISDENAAEIYKAFTAAVSKIKAK